NVTGVQTCALPISNPTLLPAAGVGPGAATERLPGLSVARAALVEALLGGVVTVLHALAMLGVVLPLVSALPAPSLGSVLDAVVGDVRVVDVPREVVRPVGVDVDVTAAPVAVSPERRAHRGPGSEREQSSGEVARGVGGIG